MAERQIEFCEMCGVEMGVMSVAAFNAAHRHCDTCECEQCQEEGE